MPPDSVKAIYRVAFALLTLVAIATQIVSLISARVFDAVNFFSYFTVESNLIATVAFLFLSVAVVWLGNVRRGQPAVSSAR